MLALHWKEFQHAIREFAECVVVSNGPVHNRRAKIIWVDARFRIYRVVSNVLRQIIRDFTCRGTRLATNATLEVDSHSVSSHNINPPTASRRPQPGRSSTDFVLLGCSR